MKDNQVEDNDKHNNNNKDNTDDKSILAQRLNRDQGFSEDIKDIKGIDLMMIMTRRRRTTTNRMTTTWTSVPPGCF